MNIKMNDDLKRVLDNLSPSWFHPMWLDKVDSIIEGEYYYVIPCGIVGEIMTYTIINKDPDYKWTYITNGIKEDDINEFRESVVKVVDGFYTWKQGSIAEDDIHQRQIDIIEFWVKRLREQKIDTIIN